MLDVPSHLETPKYASGHFISHTSIQQKGLKIMTGKARSVKMTHICNQKRQLICKLVKWVLTGGDMYVYIRFMRGYGDLVQA